MRSRFVIILSLVNLCIAGGLIWFLLKEKPETIGPLRQATEEALTDEQYWERALAARSYREASIQLSRIGDLSVFDERIRAKLDGLVAKNTSESDSWPFYQAMIQAYGNQASSQDELVPLAQIAGNQRQSLTLRDTAFRSYIENTKRMSEGSPMSEDSLRLIDVIYEERNSLAETALQAEHFLTKDEEPGAELGDRFSERLRSTLLDAEQLEATRVTALQILSEKGAVADLPLASIYETAGMRLQTSLLSIMDGMELDAANRQWLVEVDPLTPEQEQLLASILDRKY